MRTAKIVAIKSHLPDAVLPNDVLAEASAGKWTRESIFAKTGIHTRRIADPEECASDLAAKAAEKLFLSGAVERQEIDYLLFCTQTPDHILPTTACLLQHRLGLPTSCGAIDINQGCSGYVYALSLAKGLVESGSAKKVLLLTGDTYSKLIQSDDLNTRTLFGDGATATLVSEEHSEDALIGPFIFGTDGSGSEHLRVRSGGFRASSEAASNESRRPRLEMNGPEIFRFTLQTVPSIVTGIMEKSGLTIEAVDQFIFHQANAFILEHLRAKLSIPREKFCIQLASCGNTVSSSIPIAIEHCIASGSLAGRTTLVLVGFGVGLSWASTVVTLNTPKQ